MSQINASIITIGDELLIGQTIDTNSAFIAQELNKIGIWVKRRVAVGDVKSEILDALKQQSIDCGLVIITGGLGPTADDITKPTLCEYFDAKLITDESVLENIKSIFEKIRKNLPNANFMLERNLKQAEVPDTCRVLPNLRGTAPGMWFEKDGVVFISLPGVPNEMMGLIENSVVPALQQHFSLPAIVHKTLFTFGQGESMLAEALTGFETSLPSHVKLAYLPNYGSVKLRLTGKGDNKQQLEVEIDQLFAGMKGLVQEFVVAEEDITMQEAVARLLDQHSLSVGTAESCTGGYIAHLFTSRSGASSSFKGSIVSYANEVKESILGVQLQTLETHGAVSEETVKQMITGALSALKADYIVATSGILGPSGGSEEKPVGTVWIGVGNRRTIKTHKFFFRFDRKRNMEIAATNALNMLRRFIIEEEGE